METWADKWTSDYNFTNHQVGDFADLAGWYLGGFGYAWHLFPAKQSAWQPAMSDLWGEWSTNQGAKTDGRLKTHTQKFRGPVHYFHVVQKSGYNALDPDYWSLTENVVVDVESKRAIGQKNLSMHVYPNPFNSKIKIAVSFQPSAIRNFSLKIFDINGKMIKDFSSIYLLPCTSYLQAEGLSWNASNHPNGIYLVKFVHGNKTLCRKIIYNK
jgi:hypothetical protein